MFVLDCARRRARWDVPVPVDPAAPEIRDLLAEHGITPDTPLVVYCQGGGRSAFLALAPVHAGFRDVRNYFGSFGEWSRDLACPVEPGLHAELPGPSSPAITER